MRLVPPLAVLALAACTSAAPVAASWQGRTLDDLVLAWGPPHAQHTLQDGRRVVAYESRRPQLAPGALGAGRLVSSQCRIQFVVGADGRVASSEAVGDPGGCNELLDTRPAATLR